MSAPLVDLELLASPDSAAVARRAVADALRSVAVDRDAVLLMVSEAVANCVVHAYPDGVEPGRIRVRAQITEGALTVTVSDDGVGGATGAQRSGLGLGVPLISDMADEVRVDDAAGTRVTARFELFGPAGPHGRRVPANSLGRARQRLRRLLRLDR